jgi:hypothetical protein
MRARFRLKGRAAGIDLLFFLGIIAGHPEQARHKPSASKDSTAADIASTMTLFRLRTVRIFVAVPGEGLEVVLSGVEVFSKPGKNFYAERKEGRRT